MTSKIESDLVFAVLAFGYLGDVAKVSFTSIDELNPKAIYVMADKAGASWIKEKIEPNVSSRIILFEPHQSDLQKLSLSQSNLLTDYSEFGEQRFIRLTAFKWNLIHRSILDSKSDVVFSDLDVLWLSSPKINFEVDDEAIVWAQDDTPTHSDKPYFCTGIMFWRHSQFSLEVLKEMFQSQCENIISGRVIPDEPTFNLMVKSSDELSHRTRRLSNKTFVVGHRFFFSFFNSKVDSMIAFHANYVKGEGEKYQRLEAIRRRRRRDFSWVLFFFKSFVKEINLRIKSYPQQIIDAVTRLSSLRTKRK